LTSTFSRQPAVSRPKPIPQTTPSRQKQQYTCPHLPFWGWWRAKRAGHGLENPYRKSRQQYSPVGGAGRRPAPPGGLDAISRGQPNRPTDRPIGGHPTERALPLRIRRPTDRPTERPNRPILG
jgi:hypothetical protein